MGNLSKIVPKVSETVQQIYRWHEKMEASRQGPHRGRLGASVIGRPCERQLWYSFRGLVKPVFSGRLLRLFQTGHLEEPRFVTELRGIGCTVHEVDETTGKQYEYTDVGGHFVCHPDAIVVGLPEAPKTWHTAEFKTMGGTETQLSKDFEKVQELGVKTAKPEHYAQMQVAMGMVKLTRAIYLCKKKATDDIHAERVEYNSVVFHNLMDRAQRVITAARPPDRCAKRPDDFRCKWCDAYKLCWGAGEVAVPIPDKTCRSCCHATPEIRDGDMSAPWSCKLHGDIDEKAQFEACQQHLLLPDLVSFAEPVDAGDDWILFQHTKEDGGQWGHGAAEGMWTTEELMKVPASVIGMKEVAEAKEVFAGKVCGFEVPGGSLMERYPSEDCRSLAEGVMDGDEYDMIRAWLDGLEKTAEQRDDPFTAVEYEGKYLMITRDDGCYWVLEGAE